MLAGAATSPLFFVVAAAADSAQSAEAKIKKRNARNVRVFWGSVMAETSVGDTRKKRKVSKGQCLIRASAVPVAGSRPVPGIALLGKSKKH
jgi:hypothetical protein